MVVQLSGLSSGLGSLKQRMTSVEKTRHQYSEPSSSEAALPPEVSAAVHVYPPIWLEGKLFRNQKIGIAQPKGGGGEEGE